MKQVFEDMILIILLTMIAVVGSCMISANLEITQAREFHANAIERIQASHFDDSVINELIESAPNQQPEWILEVKTVSVYDDRKDMKVVLKYKITPLPLIEDRDYRTITGIAR